MKPVVLDASALLAMLFGQRGMERVSDFFEDAAEADTRLWIGAVNWAEVLYKLEQKRGKEGLETGRRMEQTLPLGVVAVDRDLSELAARLKSAYGLGLADAFAAALALSKNADFVTADTDFKPVRKEINILWL